VGWVRVPPEVIAKLESEGFAVEGGRVRLRLRMLPCPKCGKRSLQRVDVRVDDTLHQLAKALVSPEA
jgi:hypothetical protein